MGQDPFLNQPSQDARTREERVATLGQLTGGVAHELRNPLAVIKNSIHSLRMLGVEDERVGRLLDVLDREVATMNRIVTDLLDFTRTKAPARVPTRLNEVLRGVLDRRPPPPEVTLDVGLDPVEPIVEVDPVHLAQILDNLVSNAFQAMPGGGTLSVRTGTGKTGGFVSVADTGMGIPPDHLEKIFQPFFTTKAKGIGLGLALARDLATANGARITVDSRSGAGSRFTVWLGLPSA
jgi:signal transduction histidine kinase